VAAERKRLGAFYTPERLSQILTDWAIRSASDLILEPSFGGCGFLTAARRRLELLGADAPKKQIYGCDIDGGAFEFLAEALGRPIDHSRFLHKDFLETSALEDWPLLFDATIGNPPYIPYQSIQEKTRKDLIQRANIRGVKLGGKSSLWAHFLFHAVSFVAFGGRMAWVLPGSFLQADYAVNIRKYIARSFSDVVCVLMHQRFFKTEGTEEETVVLLAKGRGDYSSESAITFHDALDLVGLERIIFGWESGETVGQKLVGRPSLLSVDKKIARIYGELEKDNACIHLGDLVKVNIGLVTGANNFFVINEATKRAAHLDRNDVLPVLSKFKFAQGLSFSQYDYDLLIKEGERGFLISTAKMPDEGTGLFNYLQQFSEEEREKVSTFKKREVWHAPGDERFPDGFFPVMNHHGPRLVLNSLGLNCTNTIHRVYFREHMPDEQKKLVAISLLTSFSQISAEFVGRRYGSGVLKHEPREAEKIALFLPQVISREMIEDYYLEIDTLLRQGKHDEASAKADEVVFSSLTNGAYKANVLALALCKVRELRKTNRHRLGG